MKTTYSKRFTWLVILLAAMLALAGCDSKKSSEQGEGAQAAVSLQPFLVADLRVVPGSGVPLADEAPADEEVLKWLNAEISTAGEALALESSTENESQPRFNGVVEYQARVHDGPMGTRLISVRIVAELERRGPLGVGEEMGLKSVVMLRKNLAQDDAPAGDASVASFEELVKEAVAAVVVELNEQAQVYQGDERALLAILESKTSSKATRILAIRHARERKLEAAIPALRALMNDDDYDVLVVAASALGHLALADSAELIVDAAGRMSRERQYQEMVQLLYIVGESDDAAVKTYLETLQSAHDQPAIQRVARELLEKQGARR